MIPPVAPTAYQKYDALTGVRWSSLKHLDVSPMRYQYALRHPMEDSPALRMGRAVHAMVLEDFAPAVYTGKVRRGKAWDAFVEEHPGRDILTSEEWERAQAMYVAIRAHKGATAALKGQHEHALQWVDTGTEIECKALIDVLGLGRIVDLKTSASVDPGAFSRSVARFGYHGQLAHYESAAIANGHEIDRAPLLVVAESKPPWDVVVYDCGEIMEHGHGMRNRLMRELQACQDSGQWPGVDGGEPEPMALELPEYARETGRRLPTFDGEPIL